MDEDDDEDDDEEDEVGYERGKRLRSCFHPMCNKLNLPAIQSCVSSVSASACCRVVCI